MIRRLTVPLLAALLLAASPAAAQDAVPLADVVTPIDVPQPRKKNGKKKGVEMSGLVQVRAVAGPAESDPEADPDTPTHAIYTFRVPRARLEAGARVAGWKTRLKLAFEKAEPRLLNAYVERDLGAGVGLRVGQFKRIASLSFLIRSEAMQTLERADLLDELDVASRDIGVLLAGDWLDHRIEAAVAAYNGNGGNTVNDNPDLRTEARLDVAPLGRYDLTSRAVDPALRVRLGVGAARWKFNEFRQKGAQVQTEFDQTWVGSGFAAVRGRGLEVRSEGFLANTSAVDARPTSSRSVPLGVADRGATGGTVQLAVDVPWLPALQAHALIAYWIPNHDARRDRQLDWTAGATWFMRGDKLKVIGAFEERRTEIGDGRSAERRRGSVQIQAVF
jgi:hypothetical protein